ncbi:hypothetical protein COLO4_09222 [Corchorus olitorius]|uniref:Helitron helicase-like domain-containing protein n=1 Tax=Corchorus olitorius TaxID=93759 RepID=A0A1R3KCS2_9ROSI|nr:hypothetical protein COLO4_09222 [Corchorus olitorius]
MDHLPCQVELENNFVATLVPKASGHSRFGDAKKVAQDVRLNALAGLSPAESSTNRLGRVLKLRERGKNVDCSSGNPLHPDAARANRLYRKFKKSLGALSPTSSNVDAADAISSLSPTSTQPLTISVATEHLPKEHITVLPFTGQMVSIIPGAMRPNSGNWPVHPSRHVVMLAAGCLGSKCVDAAISIPLTPPISDTSNVYNQRLSLGSNQPRNDVVQPRAKRKLTFTTDDQTLAEHPPLYFVSNVDSHSSDAAKVNRSRRMTYLKNKQSPMQHDECVQCSDSCESSYLDDILLDPLLPPEFESGPSSENINSGTTCSATIGRAHKRGCFEQLNFGGPSCVCSFCGAHIWYGERVNINRDTDNLVFTLYCRQGSIRLLSTRPMPPLLSQLLDPRGPRRCRLFRDNIRVYNALFQLTSFGGPYAFSLNGLCYHQMGSLLPPPGKMPSVVKVFRRARDRLVENGFQPMRTRFINTRTLHERNYDEPGSEIAALLFGDFELCEADKDIIFEHSKESLKRISTLHPLCMAFQYLVLFPYGDDGFTLGIPYIDSPIKKATKRRSVTMRDFYAYLIQQRDVDFNMLLRGGRLLHQFIVDAFSSIDLGRIIYDRDHQSELRPEMYSNVVLSFFSFTNVAYVDNPSSKWTSTDENISAELLHPQEDPVGYDAVFSFMMHGPCGVANGSAPCMKEGKCSKRDLGVTVKKSGIELDNRFVVPHNVDLMVRYQAHINIEICSPIAAIKYLFKYINKGPDRARISVEQSNQLGINGEASSEVVVDEIKMYLDCRYVAAHEACWRIFVFDIHFRDPAMQRLLIHLPRQQNVFFSDRQQLPDVLSKPDVNRTMLNEWMKTNRKFLENFQVVNPTRFFETNWKLMGDDIQHTLRLNLRAPRFTLDDADLRSYVLVALEDLLHKNASSLPDVNLPLPRPNDRDIIEDRLIQQELDYDRDELQQ